MPYIIDGHNLIPKIPGLGLDEIDDEIKLVKMLQDYCRARGVKAEVFFDKAHLGGQNHQVRHPVTVHFARSGVTADTLIERRLEKLAGAARNYTVVSSDRQVQAAARAKRAEVCPSEEFARMMSGKVGQGSSMAEDYEKPDPEQEDLDEWMRLFDSENEADEK